jgi:hypothetical protein
LGVVGKLNTLLTADMLLTDDEDICGLFSFCIAFAKNGVTDGDFILNATIP